MTAVGTPTAVPVPGGQATPGAGAQPQAPATATTPGAAAPAATGPTTNVGALATQILAKIQNDPAKVAELQKLLAAGDMTAIQNFAAQVLGTGTPGTGTGQAQTGAGLTMEPVTVNTQHLAGAITGIADIVTKRQKLLAQVSIAIAQDAATNGTPNQAAIVRLNMETTNANLLNDQAKKLYDALEQSIRTWTRP